MEYRSCFRYRIDYLQWGLAQSIVDKVIARNNGADLKLVEHNISMWQEALIEAIFM